ncbi:MAG: diaminopimelate decarboxylase [Gallionellales bacterium RIFCSPLOWO2_12_FULL_59_22]|nr:MAG: diaminopimelate decarboxylase [Gallionellales bacterium RIFCSPLOWO2_02_FULL_59_110]OGT13948.1 MAG: diaminopimelate decarboxylase [Gallionellales bacterium RIFCSPLOWO2_12_FULL_59_22]
MNDYFQYRNGQLYAEQAPLADIAAQFGTPCYVYSRAALSDGFRQFAGASQGRELLVCYAVKANSNLAILNVFARLGAGFDIVSGGELQRVLAAGGDARKVVFSGVGKSVAEMRQALDAGILCFNVESSAELERLNEVAGDMGKVAPVSLRVNPDVDAKTHPYISTGLKQNKFGVAYDEAIALYRRARDLPHLRVTGIDCHIGSQLTETSPFIAAAEKILVLVDALGGEGIRLEHIDLGGGLGIRYNDEAPPAIAGYLAALLGVLRGRSEKLIIEPGRALVGNAGVLLTRVEYLKRGAEKNFAIVDAAMNDLMRPALYDAYHEILPVQLPPSPQHSPDCGGGGEREARSSIFEVVGPICETGDFIGHARDLAIAPQSLLAVLSAGAYGMSMSSNYNTRPRASEVMVEGGAVHLVRERETVAQLYAGERVVV